MLLKMSMYNKLLQCIHPDQSASADTRRDVLQWVMKELKPYAVPDSETNKFFGPPLPSTREMMEARQRKHQENVERGKRAAATRKAKQEQTK